MLRIYDVALEMTPEVERLAELIGQRNRKLKEQLQDSWPSVVLNIAEGSGVRGGNRRLRYETARGSATEALATLEYSVKAGYIRPIREELRNGFDQIIGTLVNVVYPK